MDSHVLTLMRKGTRLVQKRARQHAVDAPPTGVLRSSEALGWKGLVVEHRYHPAGEYTFASAPTAMIGIHLGPVMTVEQARDGLTFTSSMTRGSVKVVPAGTASVWRHADAAEHLHLLVTPELLHQVAPERQSQPVELASQWSMRDTRIEHIGLALLAELIEGGGSGRIYVESLATALAAHLVHHYNHYAGALSPQLQTSKGLPVALFRWVTAYIEEHLADDLGLAELAFEVGLSPSHFATLFRKTAGLSPHQYIVQRRLQRAQHLLRSTRLPMSEIAVSVGFYDQSHLDRQMRRVLGVTPTSLRERLS